MLGSAINVDVWLMLEYRLAWHAKATDHNSLPASTQHWLSATVERYTALGKKARVQFIRRPERDHDLTLFVADRGRLTRLDATNYAEFDALDLTLDALETVDEPQYFVCTNAKRDLCCSRLGRPAYARLHALVGGRAWQTTHTGGHRFAPNVLTLPDARLYGRVFADDVERLVASIEAGEIAWDYLRGTTAYPAVAQVAERAASPGARLLTCEADCATFELSADGADAQRQTLRVGPGEAVYESPPSCGKPVDQYRPLRVLEVETT